jgi:hypothetical protein
MFNFIEPICCYKKGFADPFRVSYNVFGLGEGGLVGCSNLAEGVCPLLPNPC